MTVPGRPTGDMPVDPHLGHDVEILASVADHEVDPATQALIERMVAACDQCAAIVADLRLLAIGLADLPGELPAPRDFRLSVADAARAQQGGFVRRLLRPFGIDGVRGLQPLAGALTALGLAGLLLTSLPLPLPSAASLAQDRNAAGGAAAPSQQAEAPAVNPGPSTYSMESGNGSGKGSAASPIPAAVDNGSSMAPAASHGTDQALPQPPTGQTAGDQGNSPAAPTSGGSSGPTVPPLTLASIVLLAIGLVLLALRSAARRLT